MEGSVMKTPVRLTVVFVLTILSAVWGQGSAWALGPANPPIIYVRYRLDCDDHHRP